MVYLMIRKTAIQIEYVNAQFSQWVTKLIHSAYPQSRTVVILYSYMFTSVRPHFSKYRKRNAA